MQKKYEYQFSDLKGKHPRARLPVRQLLQSPFDVDHTEVQKCKKKYEYQFSDLKGKHPRARLPVRQLLQSPFDVDHTEVQTCTSGKKSMNTSSVIGMYGWGFCREGTESGKRLCRDQPTADQPNGWLKSPPVVVFVTVTVNAVMYAGHGSNHSSSQCTSHCNPLPLTTALLCPNFGCNYMSNLQICTCHCLCHYLPKTYAVITCPIC